MDTESGNCLEFPKSPKILIKMVEALFITQESKTEIHSAIQVAAVQSPTPAAVDTGDVSTASVSTNDSGIGASFLLIQKSLFIKLSNHCVHLLYY